jgi:RimJ/RimL family protein N-acetyltransferase
MNNLFTERLALIPLSQLQLEICLFDLTAFENQIRLVVKRDFFTERVQRAIRMKVEKMRETDESRHAWLTYWLIVVKEVNIGAGMLGFKGYPDAEGSTEIGYGIAPAYQNKGYMSEAVQVLIDWAFTHPFCTTITATDVENPASSRLLERLGAIRVGGNEKFTSWEIRKVLA